MEYSVGQLIVKLLKRWYVILIVMCVFAGASLFLSQRSYEKAVAEYNAHTSQTIPASTGTLTAQFQYGIQESAIPLLQNVIAKIQTQNQLEKDYTEHIETMANGYLRDHVIEEKLQEVLFQQIQQDVASGYDLSSCVQLNFHNNYLFDITIVGLEETVEKTIVAKLQELLNADELLVVSNVTSEFVYDDPEYSDHALFAQMIMTEPVEKPNLIKVGGTAAVFGFAVACVGILLAQFAIDAKKQKDPKA